MIMMKTKLGEASEQNVRRGLSGMIQLEAILTNECISKLPYQLTLLSNYGWQKDLQMNYSQAQVMVGISQHSANKPNQHLTHLIF